MSTTEDKMKIMQAHLDGSIIELLIDNNWRVGKNPTWHWGEYTYRIQKKKLVAHELLFAIRKTMEQFGSSEGLLEDVKKLIEENS